MVDSLFDYVVRSVKVQKKVPVSGKMEVQTSYHVTDEEPPCHTTKAVPGSEGKPIPDYKALAALLDVSK